MAGFDDKELEWLLSAPRFAADRHQAKARQMRGEQHPEWVDNFFDSLMGSMSVEGSIEVSVKEDPTINKQTGIRHTVESMVEELAARVKLDAIQKSASFEVPLFVRASNEVLGQIKDYVLRHHVKPNHGHVIVEALYDAVKEQFGLQAVDNAGGPEAVKDMLKTVKQENESANAADGLPMYDGSPINVRHDYDTRDNSNFLTRPNSGGLGNYM